ncbi:MAG: IS200/IS605 family transposase [Candidatus Eisenbacteria bacterium]|uniref:IS200/IS605 family transposase n=1 Tax=Eiseniibacteriota bacterium TaxID=2212470 RepID=A0A9D6LBD4_UNCEI|nr:IS200/IS605 family transposase [Candidatus Eisenbacteria bacterium]MBI3540302.1 IS200/IS605 family transposase [Candidatus Eisenbacteria bacterium]
MNPAMAPEVKAALFSRWEPVHRSQLHYVVTWHTRGRRPVLKDRHIAELGAMIEALCEERGIALLEISAAQDHVHALFGLRPAQNVASAVRELKGHSGVALMARYPELRVWLGGNLVWDEHYTVGTVSPTRLNKVRARLRALHGGDDLLAEAS